MLIIVLMAVCFVFFFPAGGKRNKNRFIEIAASLWDAGLFRAAATGDLDALKKQLDSGSNPNIRDYEGKSALVYAASSGQADAVRILISYGAEVDAPFDSDYRTALGEAVHKGYADVVKVLLENRANPDKGARGDESGTPLMYAAARGYVDIVRLLLNAGAKVNTVDMFGKTAKDYAQASLQDPHVVALILQRASEEPAVRSSGKWLTSEEEVRAALSQIISLLSQAEKSEKNAQ
ncbi:MAG: ankyrin repeat domain-containing protein [Gammaproteobacteria bacterium]